MKKFNYLLIFISLGLLSCSSLRTSNSGYSDDTYYSLSDADKDGKVVVPEYQVIQRSGDGQAYNSPSTQNPNSNSGNTYHKYEAAESDNNIRYQGQTEDFVDNQNSGNGVVNNYYGDYYSANYSRTWRRFNDPYIGLNYGQPALFIGSGFRSGISIGYGYGFGYGFYDPFFNPFYDPFYDPFLNSFYYPASYSAWCYNPYRFRYNGFYGYYPGFYNNFYANYDPFFYSNGNNGNGSKRVYSNRQKSGAAIGSERNKPGMGNANGGSVSPSNPINTTNGNNNSYINNGKSSRMNSGRSPVNSNSPNNPTQTVPSQTAPVRNPGGSGRKSIRENQNYSQPIILNEPTRRSDNSGRIKLEDRSDNKSKGNNLNFNSGGSNNSSPSYSAPSRSSGGSGGNSGGGNSGGSSRPRPR